MAGHSKWANVKHRKARQDAKRSQFFDKAIKEITAAVRNGGPGADNSRLRQARERALAINMPRATIERAISKAADPRSGDHHEIIYEGYGPNGAAIYIEALTDNKNRCVAEVRHVLSRYGGNLGREGCVGHLFNRVGLIELTGVDDAEKLLEDAMQAGADDLQEERNSVFYLQTNPTEFFRVKDSLTSAGYRITYADLTMLAVDPLLLPADQYARIQRLVEELEDLPDIRAVHSNVQDTTAADSRV